MHKLTRNQSNVLSAIKFMLRGKRWLPMSALESFDGRTVNALHRRGLIELNTDYGVRIVK